MPARPRLTARHARALHLAAQGLATPPAAPATPADLLATIRRMSILQLDTIHVVARSQYLVLHARLGDYEQRWLDGLLDSGALFETWAHEACLAPIEDWPLHRRAMASRDHWFVNRARRALRSSGPRMRALLEHVRTAGPVKASDFEAPRRAASGWWQWKREKRWLEAWFALGELMVARRERFQRVYDLTARVHPASATATLPSAAEAARAMVERSVRALGVAQARWIHDYFRTRPRLDPQALAPLVADGTLLEVAVTGWDEPGYVHRDHADLAGRVADGEVAPAVTALLSPFDPVVWDRARAAALFGFDYRLECYLPEAKRRHGYYVLPILRRGALVGRLDAKAHRAEGRFEVRRLSLEPGVRVSDPLLADLARAIAGSARWHGTPEVRLGRGVPVALRRSLARHLGAAGPVRPPRRPRP